MIDLFNDPSFLPGIALHQPYAGLARLGIKELETRMNRCNYRGPMVICATRTFITAKSVEQRAKWVPLRASTDQYNAAVYPVGCVLALAQIVDCRLLVESDEPRSCFWDPADAGKRYAWELKDIQPLVTHPIRCMPGWFPVSRKLVEVHCE
mgnify:FL=1